MKNDKFHLNVSFYNSNQQVIATLVGGTSKLVLDIFMLLDAAAWSCTETIDK